MARLYVLGAGAGVPNLQRQTSSFLIEGRRGPVLLDAGSGLSRLSDPLFKEMVQRSRRALVLVGACSHGRLAGLPWLPFLLPGLEVTVGVPPGTLPFFEGWLEEPLLSGGRASWQQGFGSFDLVELKPGAQKVGGESVEVAVLEGHDPACVVRVRDVCYAAGCPAQAETATLAKGAALLIHDAFLDSADLEGDGSLGEAHATAAAAARLAKESGVSDLLLAHLNPEHEPGRAERLQFEASALFPRSLVATDMACVRISGSVDEDGSSAEGPEDADSSADAVDQEVASAIDPEVASATSGDVAEHDGGGDADAALP